MSPTVGVKGRRWESRILTGEDGGEEGKESGFVGQEEVDAGEQWSLGKRGLSRWVLVT